MQTEKAEYLELTFDKNVDLGATPRIDVENSSYVKDYVTTSIAGADLGPIAIDYKDAKNKKVLRVKLDTLLGTTTDVEGAKYALNFSLTGVTSESTWLLLLELHHLHVEKTVSQLTRQFKHLLLQLQSFNHLQTTVKSL